MRWSCAVTARWRKAASVSTAAAGAALGVVAGVAAVVVTAAEWLQLEMTAIEARATIKRAWDTDSSRD